MHLAPYYYYQSALVAAVTAKTQNECVMITEFIIDGLERGPQEFLSSEPLLPVEHSNYLHKIPLC